MKLHRDKPEPKFHIGQSVSHVTLGPTVVTEVFPPVARDSIVDGFGWSPVFYSVITSGRYRVKVSEKCLSARED